MNEQQAPTTMADILQYTHARPNPEGGVPKYHFEAKPQVLIICSLSYHLLFFDTLVFCTGPNEIGSGEPSRHVVHPKLFRFQEIKIARTVMRICYEISGVIG